MPFKYNALLGLGLDNTIPLDGAGKIPSTFLPSYVDDVEEYNNLAAFPATGETGKIYVAIDTGFVYRWSGSVYVQIGITAAAGSTTQVQFNDAGAFGGDSGLTFDKTTDALSAGGFIPTSSTVPANGVYLPAANSVGVATNGTGRLFVDASGNVGVGTSNPFSVLHCVGAAEAEGDAVGQVIIRSTNAYNATPKSGIIFQILQDSSSNTAYVASIHAVKETTGDADRRTALVFGTRAISGTTAERLRITSAGLVGIGTSAPTTRFHVDFGDAAANSIRLVGDGATNGTALATNWFSGASYFDVRLGGNTTSETKLRVTSAGLVGINTATPSSTLHVEGTSRFVASNSAIFNGTTGTYSTWLYNGTAVGDIGTGNQVFSGGANTDFAFTTRSTTSLVFGTNTTERARIDSSGRLLVGTSTARANFFNSTVSAALQVEGTGNDSSSLSIVRNSADTGRAILTLAKTRGGSVGSTTVVQSGDALGSIEFQGSDGTEFVQAAAIQCEVDGTPSANDLPGRLVFSTTADGAASPTERMRIGSSGITRHFTSDYGLLLGNSQSAGTTYTALEIYAGSTSTTSLGTLTLQIYNNGNVQNTNNSYGALSDIKLKENIVDANSQWDDLKALQVRNYNFKEGQTHTQIGLVAQEVELVSPGLVSESPDRDAEGNDLGTVTKSVNYSVLYMKAVKALQEAQVRIEQLESKVAALESA